MTYIVYSHQDDGTKLEVGTWTSEKKAREQAEMLQRDFGEKVSVVKQ